MPSQQSAAQRLRAAAHSGRQDFRQHGGRVSGPGTASSDSIPAQLSNGEFVLPADTVQAVGVTRLRALVKGTHQPSRKPKRRNHLADGGMPDDPSKPKPSSFGDAAAATTNPGVTQLQPTRDAASQIPTNGYPAAPKPDGSQNAWSNSELGRNVSNTMAALPGIGGIGRVAATGGALSKGINAGAGAVDGASRLLVAGGGILSGSPTASAASPANPAASTNSLVSTAMDPDSMPAAASTASGSTPNSRVTRAGNSYSGANVTGDVSINGRAPGSGGGPISAQNMAAANGLAQSQEAASLARSGLDGQAGTDAGAQFSAPTVAHSGNDWAARQRLKNLETSASSIMNTERWGGKGAFHNPAVQNFVNASRADLAAQGKAPELQLKTNEINASVQRTALTEAGANTREAGRNAVDRGRLALDTSTQAIKNRSLERIDGAQQQYLNADTAQARTTAADRLRALSGQREESPWKAVATRGERRSDGSEAEGGISLYNTQTAEIRSTNQRPAASSAPPDGTRVLGKDGRTYEVRNGQPVLVGN